MIFLELFLGFLKVGCFAFGGGYGSIPLIRDVVLSYGWMDEEMLTYMIAVSESTPGPIMVNLATYVGTTTAGVAGAAVATLAVVFPAFLITILITALLKKYIDRRGVQAVLGSLSACVIGIVLSTGLYMLGSNILVKTTKTLDIRALILTLLLAGIYYGARKLNKKISPIALIIIAALLGAVGYGI